MKLASVQAIVAALDRARVRYLVAGGLAVNVHGYRRYTKDVDLVVELTPDNVAMTFEALAALGYRPQVPLTVEQFADEDLRETLIREKGMKVLQFWSDEHRETPIDVFVRVPFPFDEEYERATIRKLADIGQVRVVSIPALIKMKEEANRTEDRIDVEYLRMRLEDE
ncbi:MAG TPA: hypothetical protein VFG78_05515 [Gemmatimonadota bacterium]|nr:hypothetical protein [Gemmatimonadota bacterium]